MASKLRILHLYMALGAEILVASVAHHETRSLDVESTPNDSTSSDEVGA